MRKQRRHKRGELDRMPFFIIAFGAGLFVAFFCSLRLALFIAVVLLIYLGVTRR